MRHTLLSPLLGLTILLGLSTPIAKGEMHSVAGYSLDLPSPPVAHLVQGQTLYVALGLSGVAIVDLGGDAPVLREIRGVDGKAEAIILMDGHPWVLTAATKASPLVDVVRASGGASNDEAEPVEPQGEATVVEVTGGSAIIDMGAEAGLTPGVGLRFIARVPVEVEALTAVEGQSLYREVEVAIGEVEVVGAGRSQVVLRRGGRTAPGDIVEVIQDSNWREDQRSALLAPQRLGDVTEASLMVRPFLAVGTLGVGTVTDLSLLHNFKAPVFLEARVQPLSLGFSRDGNLLGTSALALAGYDNPFFAIGLGVGTTVANTGVTDIGVRYTYAESDSGGGGRETFVNVNGGFTVGQVVRLGARDGLNLEVRNTFVLAQVELYEGGGYYDEQTDEWVEEDPELIETYREFRWGSTNARVTIPVTNLTDVFVDAGGGVMGYFTASGGVQSWVRGNGDRGSLSLGASAGFGLLAGTPEETYIGLNGPLLAFTARYRF